MNNESQANPEPGQRPRGGWKAVLLLAAAAVYGIVPLDAMPDVIPIFGLGDDAIVILGALFYFYRMFYAKTPDRKASWK